MSIKTYQLYCEICGYKRITDGSDASDLVELKTSPIPGGVPTLDPEAQKVVTALPHQPATVTSGIITPKARKQPKKFKCPNCGRVIMARKITPTEHTLEKPRDDEAN